MSTDAAFDLEGLDPTTERIVRLVLAIASGDFAARGLASGAHDGSDAIIVALNMLAESFGIERAARERVESLLADAVDAYDSAPDWHCSVEPASMRIVKCNKTMARALGVSVAELQGRSLLDFAPQGRASALSQALDMLSSRGRVFGVEVELLSAGGPLVASLSGNVATGADGLLDRLRLTLRDVTAQRRLEAQLVLAQRMEALGRLAGGVAHDFNNLLQVIMVSTERLARRLDQRGAEHVELSVVRQAAERAGTLTRELLAFARQETREARPVVLDDCVLDARAMLLRLVDDGTSIELRTDTGDARVVIDPGRVAQVLLNLVANARDAMPTGGHIEITTARCSPADRIPGGDAAPPDSYVKLTVGDSGAGMPPDVRERIFEPFFTTKPVGKGTGLGLATVYGIVRQARGHIDVRSEVGHGTTFSIYLPLADATLPSTPRSMRAGALSPTLLVVEDDDLVRLLTVRILQEAGYRVVEAPSGASAIEHLRRSPDSISLVVCDILMASMDGLETLARLRELAPTLPCLFVTGYTTEEERARALPGVRVLEKPFTPTTLLAFVRELLGSSPAA